MDETHRLTADASGERVDRYVAERVPSLSRSRIKQLIVDEFLTINGSPVKPSQRLVEGEEIVLCVPPAEEVELVPQRIPLTIVYEDTDVVVIDKPAGLVVHPAPGHESGTLVNALLARYPDLPLDEHRRPGIVHRLDKDTSGLIIVAKNEETRRDLQTQFREGAVRKAYLALVQGSVEPKRGVIDAPLGRDVRDRKRMAVVRKGGREAMTEYQVVEYLGDHTLLEVRPRTGRTHQVRVHLAFIRHPVAGDKVYGRRKERQKLPRQFLHAHRLGFRLPSTDEEIELVSELPTDLADVLQRLRRPGLISAEDWEESSPPS